MQGRDGLILAYSSRGTVYHDAEGTAAAAGRRLANHMHPQEASREQEAKLGSHPLKPNTSKVVPSKGSLTLPSGTSNWASSILIHEPTGDTFGQTPVLGVLSM